MKTINLQQLLHTRWGISDVPIYPDGQEVVESLRKRETFLRNYLPPPLIRRIDAGFARSNTVHPDTGNILYAICRASRPDCVFETGTYWGYSTAYLAAAMRDNAMGKVCTFDIYPKAGAHIPKKLRSYVELYRGSPSTDMMPRVLKERTPTIFFQDSRHDYEGVASELSIVVPHLKDNAVVIFHDFVAPEVQRAAQDVLVPNGFECYILETNDPQQVGVAIKRT